MGIIKQDELIKKSELSKTLGHVKIFERSWKVRNSFEINFVEYEWYLNGLCSSQGV